jgi:hypothetical protein
MSARNQFTAHRPYAPLSVRLVNSLARKTAPVFDWPASLKSEDLLEVATRRTRLQDWGDPWFKEALAALLDSVNAEGKLTFFGRFSLRQFLIGNLCSRLRTIEVFKRFPQIQQQKIHRPIFITGWYRSGTTHLHNLFALHPRLRAPLFWELRHPCPTLNPRAAIPHKYIRSVKLDGRIHGYLAPGFNAIHLLEAEKPEECLHLFDKACAGTTSFFMSEAKSFAYWLLEHGIQHGYKFYKTQLQLLNWLRPGRQWVMKWPYHLWHLETLLDTFPDATIIHLHRDPRQAIPSVCSLAAAARAPFCESIDNAALGEFWLDYYATGLKRGLKTRQNDRANRIIDIRYPDLINDPLSVIDQVQKIINLDNDVIWIKSIKINSKTTRKKKPGHHRYTLFQFGLNADQIFERFSSYIEDYSLCVGP